MRTLLRWLLRLLYGFRAFNAEALQTPGPSLLDVVIDGSL